MSIFRKLQLVSGLACGFFLFLHVLTVASLVVDPGAFDQVLFTFRQVYRPSEFGEALLVWTPLTLHLLASLGVAFERRQAPERASLSLRWLRWSGTLLLVLLGGHVLVARILPAVEGYSAAASYLAFGFENWPWGMIPYYLLIALAGAFHAGMGASVALGALGVLRGSERLRLITGFTWTGLLALALLLGTCRVMVEAPNMDPTYYSSYQRLYEHNLPWLHARNPRVR
ncbi:MAG TPA: DUF1691 domain-containing protein [Stenomitos sp.]